MKIIPLPDVIYDPFLYDNAGDLAQSSINYHLDDTLNLMKTSYTYSFSNKLWMIFCRYNRIGMLKLYGIPWGLFKESYNLLGDNKDGFVFLQDYDLEVMRPTLVKNITNHRRVRLIRCENEHS